MGTVTSSRPEHRRTVGIAVGVTLLLVLFVVGLAFANAISAGRVADNARGLHWANATFGTSALTRASLVQLATFVELEESGQASANDVATADQEARAARERLGELAVLGAESPSAATLAHFLGPVDNAIAALETADLDTANRVILSELEPAYMELSEALEAEQDQILRQIDANTAGAARVTNFIQFFLTFAIPASAVIIYRFVARRAVREMQLKANLEIEAERAVGRGKDEFIAGLSHELRTPLTSIYGFAEILTDDQSPDTATVHDLAQIIANESAEMTRMVDDLLAAARLESTGVEVEMIPTKVGDIVESAITPFSRAGLEVRQGGTDAWVSTDAARVRHVLINLLSNAAKHGGDNIGVEISSGDGIVDIEVWDDGPGVPDDQVAHLFERFVHAGSTPLLTGSIGLGLGVASRLASLVGGKLSYQRFVGKTYFILSLPAAEGSVIPAALPEIGHRSVADMVRALSA